MVAAVGKKKVNQFSGFPVQPWWLVWPFPFPGLNCFSYYPVHWLREGRTCLVNRYVEETCSTPISSITSGKIPSDAADSQSANFVASQSGKKPHHAQSSNQSWRIAGWRIRSGPIEVRLAHIETGPKQFGPNIIRNHARVWTDQRLDAAGGSQTTCRIEASRNPLPFLAIQKEPLDTVEVSHSISRREGLSPSTMPMNTVRPFAYLEPQYGGHIFRRGVSCPEGG